MEESRPVSIPAEHLRSIYHLIRENESQSFTDDMRKENHKNGKNHSDEQGSTCRDGDNSHVFEGTYQEIKTKMKKHSETEDDETNQLETTNISINDSRLNPIVPLLTDYENNTPTVSHVGISSNTTTASIEDLQSNWTIANARSADISNVQAMHYLTNDRLPMADLYSQYHVVSQHGYNTSTLPINTCDTRSSTPSFQNHESVMADISDSDEDNDLGHEQKAYGSYDVKSHSLDSNIEFEDIIMTSLKKTDGIESANNIVEQKLLTHETFSAEPPPLPFSQPPRTPPTLQINGDNFTDTIHVNGNHVVQNMSNEMYKTMKQAIKPGKVTELKKIFSDYFDDHDIENMFLPAKYRKDAKNLNIEDAFDSLNNEITGDTQRGVRDTEVRVKEYEIDKLTLSRENDLEKGMERVDKEKNFAYNELFCQVPQMQELELKQEHGGGGGGGGGGGNNDDDDDDDKRSQNEQEHLLFKELHRPVLKEETVQKVLPKTSTDLNYFNGVELRSDSNSIVPIYSTPDYLLTSSYTQNDHVSNANTTAAITTTTTKPTLVIMTPTVNKVSEGENNKVSKEIKPVLLAPPHLPAAKTERETIWKSDEEAGLLLHEVDLSRERKSVLVKDSIKETDQKEKRDRERDGQEWKEEQYKINLKCVYIAGESAAVVKKEEEELKIKKKQEEKVEKEIQGISEEGGNEIWRVTQENSVYGQNNEVKLEKQSDKLESNAIKTIKPCNDITSIQNGDIIFLEKQKLDLHKQNVISAPYLQLEEADISGESVINENKENSEDVNTEWLPTTCAKTTETIGTRTALSVVSSNKVPLVSDNATSLLNSVAFVGYNNSSRVDNLEEEDINYGAVPPRQTTNIQETPPTLSRVVGVPSPIESSAAVLLSFPTIKGSNKLLFEDGTRNTELKTTVDENNVKDSNCLSKLQPEIKSDEAHIKEVASKERVGYGNDNGKETEETEGIKAREIEGDESANEVDEVKEKYEEIKGSITEGRNFTSSASTTIRRSKSEVVSIKKENPLLRAKSIHRSEMIRPTVHSATASNEGITRTTIFPFKALRQMFEEGRPLIRDDEKEYLPSVSKTSPSIPSANIYNANTEEAKSNLYPEAHHKKFSQTAKGNDVYLSKQPATKTNKSKITCKTATSSTKRISTANNIASKLNQLSPNPTSTTSSLSSVPPDGWLEETNNLSSSSLHRNAVASDNPGVADFSISQFEEKEVPLKFSTIREGDTDKILKDIDKHDSSLEDLNVAKESTLEKGDKLLQITRLNTLPLIFRANQHQPELSTPKQNNIHQSSMDPQDGYDTETAEKVSSFRIQTHLSETGNRAGTEELVLPSNTPDDYSATIKLNTAEDNRYISQIGVNSAILVEESVQNIVVVKSKEEEKLFAQNKNNFGSVVSENTTLIPNVPISAVNNLTQGSSTIITDIHLTPMQSAQLSNVNSGHVNISSTNEITQTVAETAHPQLVKEVIMDKNIASTRTHSVGVDSTSHDTLFNNNGSVTINSVSVSSLPGIQYYSDSQYSIDTWQTAPNSTTLYTTLTPETTGLTSSDQRGLSSTWNAGIPISANVLLNTQHHSHEQPKQDVIFSSTSSSVFVGDTDSTEKSGNQTASHIQSNLSRRIVEYEKNPKPEDHSFEKQGLHSFARIQKAANTEDAETTYEKVKRNLRPIPAKNQTSVDLNVSTGKTSDSSVDDCSQITDMSSSSLRSPQTPVYYSVNESITNVTEKGREEHIADQNNSGHQYAVVRLTPSNTDDSNKVKNTIYCQVDINTSSSNLMRQRSDLSHVSTSSTLSTTASNTDANELLDAGGSDKQLKNITRTVYKNIESGPKLTSKERVERDLMKEENAYETERNILLTSTQSPNDRDKRTCHLSDMTIDSGTGTDIISSEGEIENQETTETWYEYETIPYEKYEEMSKSNKSSSTERTVKSPFRSTPPPSSLSLASIATAAETTIQHKERKNVSLTKSDSSQIYKMHTEPDTVSIEGEEDLRIVRGRLLIKNIIDSPKDGDDFDDNINVFAEEFHLDKENPLYESDPDIFKHLQDEEEEEITLDEVHQKTNAEGKRKYLFLVRHILGS